jgi:hypothetical protein
VSPGVILGEYFENSNESDYRLVNGHIVNQSPKYADKLMPGLTSHLEQRLELLEQSTDTNITIRQFYQPIVNQNIPLYQQLFERLRIQGFEFIVLRRNFEDQVLSFLIANAYEKTLNRDIWHLGRMANEPVTIPYDIGFAMRPSLVYHNMVLTETILPGLLPDAKYVAYETLSEDLASLLGHRPHTVRSNKTIQTDPYRLITNAEQVRSWIQPYKELLNDKRN